MNWLIKPCGGYTPLEVACILDVGCIIKWCGSCDCDANCGANCGCDCTAFIGPMCSGFNPAID
jgi:hypothetical protein